MRQPTWSLQLRVECLAHSKCNVTFGRHHWSLRCGLQEQLVTYSFVTATVQPCIGWVSAEAAGGGAVFCYSLPETASGPWTKLRGLLWASPLPLRCLPTAAGAS